MPIIPGENNGTPRRRESDRGSFSFPSGKNASASLAAKHFGDMVGKSDFGGSESLDKIKQQYNAGE
jgi:hypothetical protein